MFTLVVMFVIFSLFLAAIAIPLIFHLIPPNGLYGFRVRKTMENPEIWYAVNEYFGKRLFAASLVMALAAAGFAFIPGISIDLYSYAVLGVLIVTFGVAMVTSVRYLRSL